ncbi:MAG: hypothetical protein HYW25_01675 [Candidatus Aenigmarchaeota archaeon]|nr:hypothetical protein [Candidatus Aenigmarchaeota archaeon]
MARKTEDEENLEDDSKTGWHASRQRESSVSTVLIVLLAVLVLFSAAQAVQLAEIRSEGLPLTGNVAAPQQQAQVPQSLQNDLPEMQGGC